VENSVVIEVREMLYADVLEACKLVRDNWGVETADRARDQMIEYYKGGPYAPKFFVVDRPDWPEGGLAGFAAYCPSMRMKGDYDLIWIVVAEDCQGLHIGEALTRHRLAEIKLRGGSVVSLWTQKPGFFKKFGFEVVREMDSWHLMILQLEPMRI